MSDTDLNSLGEFGLIRRLSERLVRRQGVRLGIGDDAALLHGLQTPVVTCDCLVEGVHFRRDWTSARDLGYKSIAVNVSDIAAMGAIPVAAFITLALGKNIELPFIDELYAGFEEAAEQYDLTVAGGDTSSSLSGSMISVTLVGEAPNMPVLRSTARIGDIVVVTGSLGDSAAGLALLQAPHSAGTELSAGDRDFLLSRHFRPAARLAEMNAIRSRLASHNLRDHVSAGLDLSDGIGGDAAHIARSSGVTVEIDTVRLPITGACHEAARYMAADACEWALRGGEDYELLLCVAPGSIEAVSRAVEEATGTPVTVVGRCTQKTDAPVILVYPDGRRVAASGAFAHF